MNSVMVKYSGLRKRAEPSLKAAVLGFARGGEVYRVIRETSAEGYSWVMVDEGFWVASARLAPRYEYVTNLKVAFAFEVWPTTERRITQRFAANPLYYKQFNLPGHEGIDIAAPLGTDIYCVAKGEVIRARHEPTGHNYGTHVKVKHRRDYVTTYAHLESIADELEIGYKLNAGDVIGLADSTGNSTGSHLHLSLQRYPGLPGWPYNTTDPTPFIQVFQGITWP